MPRYPLLGSIWSKTKPDLVIMRINSVAEKPSGREGEVQKQERSNSSSRIEVALLTGCQDRHYAFGLATALVSKNMYLDVIGSDEIDSPELHTLPKLRLFNFRNGQGDDAKLVEKLWKLLV